MSMDLLTDWATVKSEIEGKLDDGASGYDINAKSLKVQGTDVLTSHQDISGLQPKQIGAAATGEGGTTPSTDAGKAVIVNDNGQMGISTNALGSAAYANTGGTVTNGNANLVTGGTVYTALSDKVDTTVAGDANGVVVRNSSGLAMKGTGTDISVSNAGAITVNHATYASGIPSGSQNATTSAAIWVE